MKCIYKGVIVYAGTASQINIHRHRHHQSNLRIPAHQ